jgi:NAD(P)H-dependent FMN reductase
MFMAKILMVTATSDNNRALAEKFVDAAREMGHEAELVNLAELDMPMFTVARSKELDVVPGMAELKAAMSSADSWMIIAPEYNGSMPPTLNNAVAWLSTEWQDFRALFNSRKVGLATHSGGGGEHVIMAMRQMFSYLGCNVLGRKLVSNKNKEANPETIEDMLTQLAN